MNEYLINLKLNIATFTPQIIWLLAALLTYLFASNALEFAVKILNNKTKLDTEKPFADNQFYDKLATLLTAVVLLSGFRTTIVTPGLFELTLIKLIEVSTVFLASRAIFALLNAVQDIYQHTKNAKDVPIDGLIQAFKIIISIVTIITMLSIIANKSPVYMVSGIGAFAAVLLLVFKEPILGMVGAVQVITNRLVAVGDWIEVPQFKANGDVISIGLNVIKVQNWDKTVSSIPTHAITNCSIKNWKGMSKANVRRIKRSIPFDQQSISVWGSESELHSVKESYNMIVDYDSKNNMTAFRQFAEAFLKAHDDIDQHQTIIVRTLQPTATGIHMEIYCFSKNNEWYFYENLQSTIIEELIVASKLFGLRVYQSESDQRTK